MTRFSPFVLIVPVLAACQWIPGTANPTVSHPPIASNATDPSNLPVQDPMASVEVQQPVRLSPSSQLPPPVAVPTPEKGNGRIKGGESPVSAATPEAGGNTRPKRNFEDLVADQRLIGAADPYSEVDQFRLGVMQLLVETPTSIRDAERYFSAAPSYRKRPLGRLLYAFAQGELGERQAAVRELKRLVSEWEDAPVLMVEKSALLPYRPGQLPPVTGFERYEPAQNNTVQPGGFAIVYIQVRNFRLQQQGERHLLSLRYTWELIDAYGKTVRIERWANAPEQDRMDQVYLRGPVQEFYQFFSLPLPTNLPLGDFTIRITVYDGNAPKESKPAVAEVPIHVEEFYRPR